MTTAREILFPRMFANQQPLARKSDPATSQIAASKITRGGSRSSAKAAILRFMKDKDAGRGCLQNYTPTSAELASHLGIDHATAHKRLPDLRRDGLVANGPSRRCAITGNQSITWRLV